MGTSSSLLLPGYSFSQSVDMLVHGYTTEQLQKFAMRQKYATPINAVIALFVGNIFLKFDTYPSECDGVVKHNGMEIHRAFSHSKMGAITNHNRFMVASSTGLHEGVNEWSIQTLQDHNEEVIGITSNIEDCKQLMFIGYVKGNTYYYYGGDKQGNGATIQCKSNGRRQFNSVEAFCWKKHDVITVRLDCHRWKISFFLNGKQVSCAYGDGQDGNEKASIDEWSVLPNCTYYPVICLAKAMQNKPSVFRVC